MALPRLPALMSRGRFSKVLWMAALVPLFLAAVLPSQVATLVCRFTGAMMEAEVCCPTADQGPPDLQARLLDEGCCSRTIIELPTLICDRRSEADRAQPHLDQPVPFMFAAAAATPFGDPTGSIRRISALFRPPPIAIKQSLLI